MKITKTDLNGVFLLSYDVFEDSRGYFYETYHKQRYAEFDIKANFVQCMQSKSSKNTIRGLHYQVAPNGQSKLINVMRGKILDVIVDIRFGSPTFGKHVAIELNESSKQQVWIPLGFAHGFSVLSKEAEVAYMVSSFHCKSSERGILFNDHDLNINWKVEHPTISKKDLKNKQFHEIDRDYIFEK
mgnify:FL=1